MQRAGQQCPVSPVLPAGPIQELRYNLINEELQELSLAFIEGDLVEVADAIGDLLVVVLGTAVACGINISPIFDEIHRSNMTKFIDGHRREDGKWIKGPSYEPANLQPLLAMQS
jgi:predicted HAD superfamily Cof-like phosphohydrolase